MTIGLPRSREAESRLAEIGLVVKVETAGADGEVAVIRPGDEATDPLLGELREAAVEACRAVGFHHIALELY